MGNVSQHNQYCTRIVYTSAPYPSICPLMLYLSIDFLGRIALFVHVRTCDIFRGFDVRITSMHRVNGGSHRLRANGGYHHSRVNGEEHHSLSPLRIIFLFILARSGFALANSGFTFEGTTIFRCGIATEGITIFRSSMLPLIAWRRRDCLKLMLSAVCCDKFLTLWDLMRSIFEVSFWACAFEP